MKIEVYNFNQLITRKLAGYLYLGLIIVCIGSMINGPVGSDSLFARYDAPLWLYIVTSICVMVLIVLYLNSLSSNLKAVGSIEMLEDRIIIQKGKCIVIPNAKLKKLKVTAEYKYSDIDNNKKSRKLYILSGDYEGQFDILLSSIEEKALKLRIDHIQAVAGIA